MKILFLILIFHATTCKAQVAQKDKNASMTSTSIPGLLITFPIDTSQTTTTFRYGRGFEGFILFVNSDGTFKKTLFSCDGQEPVDSGEWKISNHQLIVDKLTYELYRFQDLYYLIEISEKQKFLKDFLQAHKKAKSDSDHRLSFSGKILWAIRDDYFMK